mmetsp:Transcript_145026/g.361762  ORF Transcript_145026/g.361762 Transcript_145026/m.361762 type:complete len:567 (+) Transcript_145026:108-1808(+)
MEAKQQHQYLPYSLPTQNVFDQSVAAQQAKDGGHAAARLSALQQRGLATNLGSVEQAALAAVVGELDAELRVEVSARIDRVTVELHRELTRRFEEFQGRLDKLIELSEPLAKMDARLLRLEEARLDLRLGALESAAHHSAVFVPPPSKLDTSMASMQFSCQPGSKVDGSPASLQFSSQAMQVPTSPQYEGPKSMSYLDSHTPLKPPSPVLLRFGNDPSQLDSLTLPGVTARSAEHTETYAAVSQQRSVPPPLADLDLTTHGAEMARVAREVLEGGSIVDGSMNMGTSQTMATMEASSRINVTSSSSGCASTVLEDKSTAALGAGIVNATTSTELSSAPETRRESANTDELKTLAAAAAAAAAAYGKAGLASSESALADWQPTISDELKSRLEGLVESVKKTLGETRPQRNGRSAMPASACAPPEQQQQQATSPFKGAPVGGSLVGSVGGSLSASVIPQSPLRAYSARVLSPVRSCSPVRGSASVLIPQVPSQITVAPGSGSALITQEVQMREARVTEMHIGPPILRSVSITRHRGASPTRASSPIRSMSPQRLIMTSAVIPAVAPP